MTEQIGATTSTSDYSIQIEGSLDVPDRTAYIDDEDFSDQEFTVTGIARFSPGEDLIVDATAPSGTDYQLELLDNDMNTVDFSPTLTGDDSYTFDTSGRDPGTYGVVAFDTDGTAQAMFPVVLRGFSVDILSGPSTLQSSDDLTVEADLTDLNNGATLHDVRLILMSKSGDTGGDREMTLNASDNYEGTIPDIEDNEYVYGVLPRGTETIDIDIDGVSFISGNKQGIGTSEVRDLSVSLSDADKLAQQWTADSGGRIQFSSPAVNNDFAFIGGLDETTEARWRDSGSQKWSFVRSGSLSDSSPLLESGTVYIGSGGGVFYALNASDGTEQWSVDVGSAVTSSPAVVNGTVYFGTNDGDVYAVDAANGTIESGWPTPVGSAVYSDLAAGGGLIFATTSGGDVVALNPDGTEAWRFSEGTEFQASSPQYADSSLYVAGSSVYRLDPASGTVEWEQTNFSGTAGSDPVLDQSVVFVGASDGRLHALNDGQSGSELWTASTGDDIASNPVAVADRVVTGSLDGSVYVFDRTTGNEVWSESIGSPIRSSPVVRTDQVYFGTESGTFYALENIP